MNDRLGGFAESVSQGQSAIVKGRDKQAFQEFYTGYDRIQPFRTVNGSRWTDVVCNAPVTYQGAAEVQRDIANLTAASAAAGAAEAFITAVAPGSIITRRINQHYASDEAFLFAIAAAMISLPLNYALAREGYRQLVGPQDYRKLGVKFISQEISAPRSYAAKNREVVAAAINATLEGLKFISAQEAQAKKILAKYTRQTEPESHDRAYRFGLETLNRDPTIPREAVVSMVRLMADLNLLDRNAAANTPPEAFYDNSFVDEMKSTGFLRELWK